MFRSARNGRASARKSAGTEVGCTRKEINDQALWQTVSDEWAGVGRHVPVTSPSRHTHNRLSTADWIRWMISGRSRSRSRSRSRCTEAEREEQKAHVVWAINSYPGSRGKWNWMTVVCIVTNLDALLASAPELVPAECHRQVRTGKGGTLDWPVPGLRRINNYITVGHWK